MDIRIETPRLILREYQLSDLPSIHAYASQPLVVQYESWGPNTLSDTEQFLQQTQFSRFNKPRVTYELGIERRADGRHIGGCELAISPDDGSLATIGYIVDPSCWQQGYATEASRALIDFAANQLNVTCIRATCDSRNAASRRVLEKSGFVLEATLPDDYRQKGVMRTTLVFVHQPDLDRK
jgi:ribosomal-protein-alanine N-acetyltransferase